MTQKLFSFVAIIFALITDSRKEMPSQFSTNRMGLLTELTIALYIYAFSEISPAQFFLWLLLSCFILKSLKVAVKRSSFLELYPSV